MLLFAPCNITVADEANHYANTTNELITAIKLRMFENHVLQKDENKMCCPKCGKMLSEKSAFCRFCGALVNEISVDDGLSSSSEGTKNGFLHRRNGLVIGLLTA